MGKVKVQKFLKGGKIYNNTNLEEERYVILRDNIPFVCVFVEREESNHEIERLASVGKSCFIYSCCIFLSAFFPV